jgi:ATP-dependent Clp protease ATP-binding subunit ClpA
VTDINRILQEYEAAINKKRALSERLRQTETTEPNNSYQIWILRDQIAYWEGKSEGLKFALDELEK